MSEKEKISHHKEFPKEEMLNPKSKLIITTVRSLVTAIGKGENTVVLRRYKKDVNWKKGVGNLGKIQEVFFDFPTTEIRGSSVEVKKNVKELIHDALASVGIDETNTEGRITTALQDLGKQYRNMGKKRFRHRNKTRNQTEKKVIRDGKFLVDMVRYMSQQGETGLQESIDMLACHKGNYQRLKGESESMGALYYFLNRARETFGDSKEGKRKYRELVKILKDEDFLSSETKK